MKKRAFTFLEAWRLKQCFSGFLTVIFFMILAQVVNAQYQMEKLNRGVVAVRTGSNNFISWRFLGTEDDNITFNLYRGSTKVNAMPLNVTNYTDNGAAANSQYYVRAIISGVEQPQSETVGVWGQQYLNVPLQLPAGGSTSSGAYTYNANDCSVGDVDGDGIYEIFVKWDPTNSKDNSQAGFTGNTLIDAYRLNGTRLWRIDLGRNIRSGAHYTQFQVYDYNGDGKAEMMVKTADGTRDGTGRAIGNANVDHRNSGGYILTGPEFLTVFNGLTGAAMATVNYLPGRGTVSSWGDPYGNRVDRFRAGTAYLDGKKPSAIFGRGYYTRTTFAAWDWNGTNLTNRWVYDSGSDRNSPYYEGGNHSLSVADVDNDGKQEIISGSCVIDDNGRGLYATGFGHGDAGHVSDFDLSNPGQEIFNIQENGGNADCYLYSALQKRVIWRNGSAGDGPGRGVMANISDNFPGAEAWVAGGQTTGGPWRVNGTSMGTAQPPSANFLIYWDGNLARELLNSNLIDSYTTGRLLTANGATANNGTKSTPNLSGDLLGDWREELILRTTDNRSLRIYTTTIPTTFKVRTLVHDPQYRVALAWQNTAYNQPPHPSFFLGSGVALPAKPNITIIGGSTPGNIAPVVSVTAPANNASIPAPANVIFSANATDNDGIIAKVEFYNGTVKLGEDLTAPYSYTWNNVIAGTYSLTARAIDDDGAASTSSVITIRVTSANPAPTVSITSPTNNTVINGAPATVIITANAADANGTVAKVEFFEGTNKLGEDLTAGYAFNWSNIVAGTYTLTAVATDNLGSATTSTPVIISVIGSPSDCNNVSGGQAKLDECGRCTGGNTGKTACISVMEAENACKFDGIKEDVNEGYNDSGYVNVSNTVGASVSFSIMAQNSGNATISFRFANGGTLARPGQISVNGAALPGTVTFDSTGSWIDWEVIDVPLTLVKGDNGVVLSATTAGGLPNIDQIGFVSSGLSSGDCSIITGISDNTFSDYIKLFPNPSNKEFNLIMPDVSDVKVMNTHGITVDQANHVLNYQFGGSFVPGIYMVQVLTNGNTQVYRVVKK